MRGHLAALSQAFSHPGPPGSELLPGQPQTLQEPSQIAQILKLRFRGSEIRKTEIFDFSHMASQGLREVPGGQKTLRHLIPEPDNHEIHACSCFLGLKTKK